MSEVYNSSVIMEFKEVKIEIYVPEE